MSASNEAVADLAERLDGVLEELSDMALDALRLASAGDPDSAETGEALALERRILKARRALERSVAALREGIRLRPRAARRRRLTSDAGRPVRTFVAAWPDDADAPTPGRARAGPREEPAARRARPAGT